MQYNPSAKRPNMIWPKGEYPGQIIEAEEKTSKAGNPMLVVNVEIYDGDRKKNIRDFIVTGGEYSQDWKLGHLAAACGLPKDGEICADQIVGRMIRCRVKIKPAKGDYPEDNAIDDYVVTQAGDVTQAEVVSARQPVRPGIGGGIDPNSEPPFLALSYWG